MYDSLDAARRWFAEDLRMLGPVVHTPAVVEAFARVPREAFCGAPPWRYYPRQAPGPISVPTDDPRALYHDVLVELVSGRGLNNGQPSLWAHIFDQLKLAPGHRVLQIGAGAGYYTAILAEIVGPRGRVDAIEIDVELAARARKSLQPWPWATIHDGNGAAFAPGTLPGEFANAIVVCAGATHPTDAWLDHLRPGGRIMVPLTAAQGRGILLLAEKAAGGFHAASMGPSYFIRCEGARSDGEAERLQAAVTASGPRPPLRSMHRGKPTPGAEGIWLEGDAYWLSTQPLA